MCVVIYSELWMTSVWGMRLKNMMRGGARTVGHPSPAHYTSIRTQKMLQIYITFTQNE